MYWYVPLLSVVLSVSSELEKSANRLGLIFLPLRLTTSFGDSSPWESNASCLTESLVDADKDFAFPRLFFTSGLS